MGSFSNIIMQRSRSLEKLCPGMFDTTCDVFLTLVQCSCYYPLQYNILLTYWTLSILNYLNILLIIILLNCLATGYFSHFFLTFSELPNRGQPALLGSFRTWDWLLLLMCPSRNWEDKYQDTCFLTPLVVIQYFSISKRRGQMRPTSVGEKRRHCVEWEGVISLCNCFPAGHFTQPRGDLCVAISVEIYWRLVRLWFLCSCFLKKKNGKKKSYLLIADTLFCLVLDFP